MFERARSFGHPIFRRRRPAVSSDLDRFTSLRLTPFDTTTEVVGTLGTSVERKELIQPMVAIEILCNPIPQLPYLIMPKSHIQPPP
jgi:hypothetical protein